MCNIWKNIIHQKILNKEIYGRKKHGQLRKCWITDMEEDLKRMSIQIHKVKNQDQVECTRFVQEAKVNTGLLCQTNGDGDDEYIILEYTHR